MNLLMKNALLASDGEDDTLLYALLIALALFVIVASVSFWIITALAKDEKSKKIIAFVKTRDECNISQIADGTGLKESQVKCRLNVLVPGKELKEYMRAKKDGTVVVVKKSVETLTEEMINSLPFSERVVRLLQKRRFETTHIYKANEDWGGAYEGVHIDEKGKQIAVVRKNAAFRLIPFEKLIGFELYENGDKRVTGKGGRVLLGGFFLGGVGALAGAMGGKKEKETCSTLELHIKIDDLSGLEILKLITQTVDKDSEIYKSALMNAKEIVAALDYILNHKNDGVQTDEI